MSEHWTADAKGYLEPKVHGSGASAFPAKTVIEVFKNTVDRHGGENALALKRKPEGGHLPKEWQIWTWRDYWEDCKRFAKTLIYLGVESFSVTNILGFNSPEWFIANNGSIVAGCIAAGIYATNTGEACKYITEHSEAPVVVMDGNKQLAKYAKMDLSTLPKLKVLVVWEEDVDESIAAKFAKSNIQVLSWAAFMGLGSSIPDEAIEGRLANVKAGNCSTLIYTSGTTGPPKAVMISHDNVTWTTKVIVDSYMELNHQDRVASYLPLSHIAAQLIDIHVPMNLGACTYFCQPDALKGSLTKTLTDMRPTFFFGVPRVWEKVQEAMVAKGRETKGLLKALSTWAKSMATEKSKLAQFGARGGAPCGFACANILLTKIKQALGLDQCKACFTAAAPIAPETLWYFASLDIPVYEIFGQSECTGPHTVSCIGLWKIGSCGRPIFGSETKIDPTTKELCYRGRHIFMGYLKMPDKTAETIDSDGFLHSGDVAEFDDDNDPRIPAPSGFMKITGRIKELIITAGGENVPPVLIENEMKAAMPALSNCMVIGDKRKYLSMVISLKVAVDPESGAPTDELAGDSLHVNGIIGSTATTLSEASVDPLWIKYINDGVKVANSKTTSSAQIVQKWKMLPVDFSEKAGDLTPTLKLKRNVVTEKYHDLIESIYADDA